MEIKRSTENNQADKSPSMDINYPPNKEKKDEKQEMRPCTIVRILKNAYTELEPGTYATVEVQVEKTFPYIGVKPTNRNHIFLMKRDEIEVAEFPASPDGEKIRGYNPKNESFFFWDGPIDHDRLGYRLEIAKELSLKYVRKHGVSSSYARYQWLMNIARTMGLAKYCVPTGPTAHSPSVVANRVFKEINRHGVLVYKTGTTPFYMKKENDGWFFTKENGEKRTCCGKQNTKAIADWLDDIWDHHLAGFELVTLEKKPHAEIQIEPVINMDNTEVKENVQKLFSVARILSEIDLKEASEEAQYDDFNDYLESYLEGNLEALKKVSRLLDHMQAYVDERIEDVEYEHNKTEEEPQPSITHEIGDMVLITGPDLWSGTPDARGLIGKIGNSSAYGDTKCYWVNISGVGSSWFPHDSVIKAPCIGDWMRRKSWSDWCEVVAIQDDGRVLLEQKSDGYHSDAQSPYSIDNPEEWDLRPAKSESTEYVVPHGPTSKLGDKILPKIFESVNGNGSIQYRIGSGVYVGRIMGDRLWYMHTLYGWTNGLKPVPVTNKELVNWFEQIKKAHDAGYTLVSQPPDIVFYSVHDETVIEPQITMWKNWQDKTNYWKWQPKKSPFAGSPFVHRHYYQESKTKSSTWQEDSIHPKNSYARWFGYCEYMAKALVKYI